MINSSNFIIKKTDGSSFNLFDKIRPSTVTSANQSVTLLGDDIINISVKSGMPINFNIGDKITIIGRDYTLNIPAKEKKVSANLFTYELQFEGVQYDLSRATYDVNIDTTGSDVQSDSLTGDIKRFLDVLIANISRIFPGKWILGTYPVETESMTLTFGETDNCLSILQTLCEKFNQEFDIAINSDGTRTINIGQAGKTFGFTFQYGMNRGIYDLTREKVSSSNIVTRLKVYGSTKNITSKYRSSKLLLPGKTKPQSFLEDTAAIAKYGVWENTKNFDSIFPHRTGVVSGLGNSVLEFVDSSMSFDLNEKEADGVTTKYLLSGTTGKVHFNTGKLAGYEFDIHSYDHATKTFKIKSQTDENDYTFPSETSSAFQIGVGDEYVLLDIALPQSYVDTAEAELLAAGTEYLAQNCQPKVQYSLTVDKLFLASTVGENAESNIFWVGDYIPIQDDDIDVDKLIRIKGFTRDLLTDYSYNLTISDLSVTKLAYNRIISDLIDIDKIITINNLKDPARARRNYLNAQEVLGMVFDPEGDYYTDKIKPESVDTVMLSVGAKSMQFGLIGTVFQPNYGGNKNRIVYKGGVLTHYAIVDANKVPRSWTLTDGDQTLLSDGQAYYIYAKCEKEGSGGSILFSTSQITVESDPSYYHFWIGVLNSVDTDLQVRAISLNYGFTLINGRFIKTGKIESSGGSGSFFDLDENQFQIGDSNKGLFWNIDENGKFLFKGVLVQSESGVEQPLGCFRGVYGSGNTYYKGDEVTYNGSTYRYIYNTPISNITPTNTTYWIIIATAGSNGVDGAYFEYKYAKNGSTTTPLSIIVTDNNPSGWTNTMPVVGSLEYLWMTVAKKTATGTLLQNWSTPTRITGVNGTNGIDGTNGPALVNRGLYDSTKTYYGNNTRVDTVKYNNVYYVTRTDAGIFTNKLPTNTTYWNEFGSSFESIATGLLLADWANLAGFIFQNEIMYSQDVNHNTGDANFKVNGANGRVDCKNINITGGGIDIEIDGQHFLKMGVAAGTGVIQARADSATVAALTTYGANASAIALSLLSNSSGYGKALDSYGNVELKARAGESILINGLRGKTKTLGAGYTSYQMQSNDDFIQNTSGNTVTITMPNAYSFVGKYYFVLNWYGNITLNGGTFLLSDGTSVNTINIADHKIRMLINDEYGRWICGPLG